MAEIDVVVPTYRRPDFLERCLEALARQQHQASRILVVIRTGDDDSQRVAAKASVELATLETVEVSEPGVIAAMTAGVTESTAPFIAFTDDDARPRPDWLTRMVAHLEDETVGGVGGRDIVCGQEGPLTPSVGRFGRTGKLVGNHHLGMGPPRDVDVLKGVNMAFRVEALALPAPGVLRGEGAQVDFEILTCTWARRRGWRLVYDPGIIVDHDAAPRGGADQRVTPASGAIFDAAYNSVIAVTALGGPASVRRGLSPLALGTSDRPGIVRSVAAVFRGEREVLSRARPALAGRCAALWARLRRPGVRGTAVVPASALRQKRVVRRRPTIALVAHDIHDHGGMERVCAELIRRAHGDVDFVVVATHLAPELKPLVRNWVPIRVPPRPFPLKFVSFWLLAGLALRRLDADLVHTVGAIVPNRVDVASIHFCHAGYRAANAALAPADAPALRRVNTTVARSLALAAERWSYRPARLRSFAAVSRGVADELTQHYPGVPAYLTPNGVDLERFHPDPQARADMRAAEGVGDSVVALFVGGDWHHKGLPILLEAAAQVRSHGHNLRVWVVGRGDEQQSCALAAELGIGDQVRFFGVRADTDRFYQAADVFVLPSAYETFSLVCFEAAAAGLPLVIPRISGASELVGGGEGGLLVGRSVSSVAAALARLAGDPALRTRLGQQAQERATSYTWERSASSVTALYQQLLKERA